LLHQKKKISEKYVCFFTACIILGYQALHENGFVYRDMKPANVLLKENGYCCLIDFGLTAKVTKHALKGRCGTRGYWAPEMVKGDQYLYSVDWWSLGVTLIELLTGKRCFKKKFQKYKHTEDKMQICKAGDVDDKLEEADIEKKLGKALEHDDDDRDSAEEDTDDESDDGEKEQAAAAKRRKSSVRIIGTFEKTIPSVVDSSAALTLCESCLPSSKFAQYLDPEKGIDNFAERFMKVFSVLPFDEGQTILAAGEPATFVAFVISGTIDCEGGETYAAGTFFGEEGLSTEAFKRSATCKGGAGGAHRRHSLRGDLACRALRRQGRLGD